MATKLPRPPTRGQTTRNDQGVGEQSPTPSHVSPQMRAMTRHDARMVNLDTGTHVDSQGVEHKTHPGNKPQVGPLTVIMASNMGHPAMRFGDHAKRKTNVHKHMRGKGNPHPNAIAIEIAGRMKLPKAPQKGAPEGSPGEEAAETPQEEAAEMRAGTEKPTKKRLPLPPRKAA